MAKMEGRSHDRRAVASKEAKGRRKVARKEAKGREKGGKGETTACWTCGETGHVAAWC